MKTKHFLYILFLLLIPFRNIYPQIFWEERPIIVSLPLTCVSNYNAQNAYICGDSGTVLRTSNYGYNWSKVGINGIPSNIMLGTIYALNETTVITAGTKGDTAYAFRTTNSGANWSVVFQQANTVINGIYLNTSAGGILIANPTGGRWSIWKTTNTGANWDSSGCYLPQSGSESGFKNSFHVVGTKYWFGTNNTRIYYSSNSGTSWSVIQTNPLLNSSSIWWDASPSLVGYAAGSSLLKTTNGGLNYVTDTATLGSGNFDCVIASLQLYNGSWYIRNSSNIYFKWNNPYWQWTLNYTAPSGIYTHIGPSRIQMITGPGWMYAVRSNGGISRGNAIVEGVRLVTSKIPDEYKLYQNYPNPFNSSTKFKFDTRILPKSVAGEIRGGNIKLIIYNSIGQEVETLIDKVLQPAVYEASWDGSKYSSGVYMYRFLVTNPNGYEIIYDAVKKMVMLK